MSAPASAASAVRLRKEDKSIGVIGRRKKATLRCQLDLRGAVRVLRTGEDAGATNRSIISRGQLLH